MLQKNTLFTLNHTTDLFLSIKYFLKINIFLLISKITSFRNQSMKICRAKSSFGFHFRMARVPLISNRSTDSSIFFHEKAYGQNIRLYDNASTATRHTSFDHG